MWGNGTVVYSGVSVCLLSSSSLSNFFFCALWCSIQVINHVHVNTLVSLKLTALEFSNFQRENLATP